MPVKLTRTQTKVLAHLLAGMTNEEVGAAIGISKRTVEYHRRMVMEHLRARSSIELGHLATVAGIEPARPK